MNKKIKMEDVAKAAGVSKSTVSQYLNQRYHYMSVETRDKIGEAIKELDYKPNVLARSLKLKTTATVGVIIANILHKFSTEVIRAVEDYYHSIGYNVILCNSDNNPEKEEQYIEMLISKQVDGILLIPTEENVDLYNSLLDRNFPLVFIDRKVEGVSVPAVITNNEETSYQLTEHLIGVGYENVVFVSEPLSTYTRIQRKTGYQQSIQKHGCTEHVLSDKLAAIPDRLDQYMLDHPGRFAIIAANDLVFQVVMEHMRAQNLTLGEDFAIVVFDNIPIAKMLTPMITTVVQPSAEIGKEASAALLDLIQNPDKDMKDLVLDCEIVFRESSEG